MQTNYFNPQNRSRLDVDNPGVTDALLIMPHYRVSWHYYGRHSCLHVNCWCISGDGMWIRLHSTAAETGFGTIHY